MGSYNIQWKRSAEQDLLNIDRKQISRIIKAIESLITNPFPIDFDFGFGSRGA